MPSRRPLEQNVRPRVLNKSTTVTLNSVSSRFRTANENASYVEDKQLSVKPNIANPVILSVSRNIRYGVPQQILHRN